MVQSGQKSKIVEETLYIVDASVYGKSLVSHGKLQALQRRGMTGGTLERKGVSASPNLLRF